MARWQLVKEPGKSLGTHFGIVTYFSSSFVLADTSQLHSKITEMGQRIRQLEDALAISHSGVSNEQHPLLRDELLSIKFGPENGAVPQTTRSRDASMESMDAFGTLTIFDRDQSKYFGRSAGTEVSAPLKLYYCTDVP